MSPRALAAALLVLAAAPVGAQTRAVKARAAGAPAGSSAPVATPKLIGMLESSLGSPTLGELVHRAPSAPGIDHAKAAAFLGRAQRAGASGMAAAAVPAGPDSLLVVPAALGPRAVPAPGYAPGVEVLRAVTSVLGDVPLDGIERMPAAEVERRALAVMARVTGEKSRATPDAAAAAIPGSLLLEPRRRLRRAELTLPSRGGFRVVETVPARETLPADGRAATTAKLRALPPTDRARLGRYLGQAHDLLSGKGGAPVGKGAAAVKPIECLACELEDLRARAPRARGGRRSELADEADRLLADWDGTNGFNSFLVEFALDVYVDLQKAGRLNTAVRRVKLKDPRSAFPALVGAGPSDEEAVVRDLPLVSEADLSAAIERRLLEYGFSADLALAATPVKPAEWYARALQRLYLAHRFSRPEENSFGKDVLQPFLRRHGYFGDDLVEGVPGEHAGRRSPHNPEHVVNLLRLLFDLG